MRTYAISCLSCLLALDLICALRRRGRRGGGDADEDDDDDDELMDMTSGGWDSSGEESDRGRESGSHSDGEGRNKGGLDERRGGSGERDDEERLAVSNGESTGLYHTTCMHTRRRKGGWYERIDTPADQDALGQRPVTWPWPLDAVMTTMMEVVTEILALQWMSM